MTTHRCTACGKKVETELLLVDGILRLNVKPCEVCLRVAEEGVREEAYEKGYQEGWQAGYDTNEEEEVE